MKNTKQTAEQIKQAYWACRAGYETSLDALVALGYSEGAADDYLHLKDNVRRQGEMELTATEVPAA